MKKNIMIGIVALLLSTPAIAAYYVSDVIIEDNREAITECPLTCEKNMTTWTGRWFTTQDPFSVCECFHGWPYCPEMLEPSPVPPCVSPRQSSQYVPEEIDVYRGK